MQLTSLHYIDYSIIGGYLILILLLGIWKGWRIQDVWEYAVGGRNFGTAVILASMFSPVTGGFMGLLENFYVIFFVFLLIRLGYSFSYFIFAKYFTPSLAKFSDCVSVGGFVGKVYGKWARVVAGILGFLYVASLVGIQFKILGYLLQEIVGFSKFYSIICGAVLIIIYSSIGGIKGVALTDVVQVLCILVVIPLLFFVSLKAAGGFNGLFSNMPFENLRAFDYSRLPWDCIPIFLLLALPGFSPPDIQRFCMCRDVGQAKKVFNVVGLLNIPFCIIVAFIGISAFVRNPDIPVSNAILSIINDLVPCGLKGMVIVGFIAAIMSASDSFVNTCSVLLSRDVISPLFNKSISVKKELCFTRVISIFVGILGVSLAFITYENVFKIYLLVKAFWLPTIVIPLTGILLGYRSKAWRFWAGVGSGIAAYLICIVFFTGLRGVNPLMVGVLVNALIFFDFPKLFRAWKGKRKWQHSFRGKKYSFANSLKNSLPSFKKLSAYASRSVNRHGADWLAFGVFIFLNYLMPLYLWTTEFAHFNAAMFLRVFSILTCIVMMSKNYWPKMLQGLWPLFWFFNLTITLVMTSIFMLFDSPDLIYSLTNITLSFLVLLMLVEWRASIFILIAGIFMGVVYYSLVNCFSPHITIWKYDQDIVLTSICLCGFAILAGVLFARKRQIRENQRLIGFSKMSNILVREFADPLSCCRLIANENGKRLVELNKRFSEIKNGGQYDLGELACDCEKATQAVELQNKMFGDIFNSLDILVSTVNPIPEEKNLNFKKLSAEDFVEKVILSYPFKEGELSKVKSVCLGKNFEFKADEKLLTNVVCNLIRNALQSIAKVKDGRVSVRFNNNGLHSYIMVEDNGPGIAIERQKYIFEKFETTRKNSSGLGLFFCKEAMEVMGGSIRCYSSVNQFTRFVLVFNMDVVAE